MSTFGIQPYRGHQPVLVIALVLLAVFVFVGAAIVQFGFFDLNNGTVRQEWLQARSLACSGADATAQWFIDQSGLMTREQMDEALAGMFTANNGVSKPTRLPGLPEGTFTIRLTGTRTNLHIESVGEINNRKDTQEIELYRLPDGRWSRAAEQVK